jgi:hypothetical protein
VPAAKCKAGASAGSGVDALVGRPELLEPPHRLRLQITERAGNQYAGDNGGAQIQTTFDHALHRPDQEEHADHGDEQTAAARGEKDQNDVDRGERDQQELLPFVDRKTEGEADREDTRLRQHRQHVGIQLERLRALQVVEQSTHHGRNTAHHTVVIPGAVVGCRADEVNQDAEHGCDPQNVLGTATDARAEHELDGQECDERQKQPGLGVAEPSDQAGVEGDHDQQPVVERVEPQQVIAGVEQERAHDGVHRAQQADPEQTQGGMTKADDHRRKTETADHPDIPHESEPKSGKTERKYQDREDWTGA